MKRLLTVATGLVAGLSGIVALSPAASAYNGYDATATNVSYTSDSCYNSRVSVSGFGESEDDDGHDIDVYAPGGAWAGGDYAFGSYSDSFNVTLCNGIDITGRYSVQVDGREVASFTVARPAITTRVVNPRSRLAAVQGHMTLRGRAMVNRNVALQHLSYGSWSTVASARTTSAGNMVGFCKKRGTLRGCAGYFRFAFNGVAASRAFHLPQRR